MPIEILNCRLETRSVGCANQKLMQLRINVNSEEKYLISYNALCVILQSRNDMDLRKSAKVYSEQLK